MDTSQWPQELVMKPMEQIIPTTDCSSKPSNSNPLERKVRPQKDQALNCPRCNSTNTKFCYYNNYNLSQPRYFCKTCRRYWTEGGTLRNIPVGGGSRKNKRSSSSVASSTTSIPSIKKINNPQDLTILSPSIISQNPNKLHESQDLNLGFPSDHHFKSFTELIQAPNFDNDNHSHCNSKENLPSSTSSSHQLSAMELLNGITPSSRGFNSFIPILPPQGSDHNNVYSSSSGFSMPLGLKPSLDFSLYGLGNNNNGGFDGNLQNVHQDQGNGRFLFPFENLNLKQASTTSTATTERHQHNNKEQNGNINNENSSGYWNGVLGGSTW